jgi:hypothetical protein
MNPPRPRPRNWVEVVPTDEDVELAKNTIDHFLELDPEDNDYLTNCQKIAQLGYIHEKMCGIAASMVFTYKRTLFKKAERESRPESNYVGEVKERLRKIPVKCVFETMVDGGMYGPTHMYILIDNDGNKYSTFYSGSKWHASMHDKDKRYFMTATVKAHDEYRGEKQTKVTRCVLEEITDQIDIDVNDIMPE